MTSTSYYSEQITSLERVRSAIHFVPPPIAFYLERFCNAQTPVEARTHVDDFFKVTNHFIFLYLISLFKHIGLSIPGGFAKPIREKILNGSRGLTEGERLDLIEALLRELATTDKKSAIAEKLKSVYGVNREADISKLLSFKTKISHKGSGDDNQCFIDLKNVEPHFVSFVEIWEGISNLELMHVKNNDGYRLSGIGNGVRCDPKGLKSGMYIVDKNSGEVLDLYPFVKITEDSTIELFSHAKGKKKPTGSVYHSMWPKVGDTEGSLEVVESLAALIPLSEEYPLFGLQKQTSKLSTILKDWYIGKIQQSIVFVTGEEGTGKTSVINLAIKNLPYDYKCIVLSGDSGLGEINSFCFEILAGIFEIEPSNERLITERLISFGDESGAFNPTEVLRKYLLNQTNRILDSNNSTKSSYYTGTENEKSAALYELNEQDSESQVSKIQTALISIIKIWCEREGRKVIIWFQDAQLYEKQHDIQFDGFLKLIRKAKIPSLILIPEFRAERTRDSKRIREKFDISSSINIETFELNKKEIVELVAWKLEIPVEDLSEHVGAEIYKSSGGNPKWILDFIQTLIARNTLQVGQSAIEISLILPRQVKSIVSGELKNVTKSRLQEINLTQIDFEVLMVLAFSSTRVVPAAYVARVVGGDVHNSLRILEDNGFIRDDPAFEEWSLVFEHLATKQACQELFRFANVDHISSLAKKYTNLLQNEEGEYAEEDARRLTGLVRELATITGDPEALANTLTSLKGANLADLRAWAIVLRRAISPSHYLVALRDYIGLRIIQEEKEEHSLEFLSNYIARAGIFHKIEGNSRFWRYLYIKANTLATLIKLSPGHVDSLVKYFISYCELLNGEDYSAITPIESINRFSLHFSVEVGRGLPDDVYQPLNTSIHEMLSKSSVDKILRNIVSVNCKIFLGVKAFKTLGGKDLTTFHDDRINKVEEITEYLETETFASLNASDKETITALISYEINLLVASISDDLAFDFGSRLFAVISKFEKTSSRDLTSKSKRTLIHRISRHHATASIDSESSPFLSFLSEIQDSRGLKLIAISTYISECFRLGKSFDWLIPKFSTHFLEIEDFTDFEVRDFSLFLSVIDIVELPQVFSCAEARVLAWIDEKLKVEDNLENILELIEEGRVCFNWKTKDKIDYLVSKGNWKDKEPSLIKLARARYIDSGKESEWVSSFNVAKEQYMLAHSGQGGEQKSALLRSSFSLLVGLVESCKGLSSASVCDRLRQFLKILEERYPEGERDLNLLSKYWRLRWKILIRLDQRALAIEECRSFFISDDASNRKKLVPVLASLMGPVRDNDDVDEDSFAGESEKRASGHARNSFTLAAEMFDLAVEWSEIEPYSSKCAIMLIRLASYREGSEANFYLEKAEGIANKLYAKRDFKSAQNLYGGLLVGYYRVSNASKASSSFDLELDCIKRIRPRPSQSEINAVNNNGNYVKLALAVGDRAISSDLLENLRHVAQNSVVDSDSICLYQYNFIIGLTLSGQLKEAYEICMSLFSNDTLRDERNKQNIRWAFIYNKFDNASCYLQLESLPTVVYLLFTQCQILIDLNRRVEACMWALALEKRIKLSISHIKNPHVYLAAMYIYSALEVAVPSWIDVAEQKISSGVKRRLETFQTSLEDLIPKKNDLCPCGSHIAYRECCHSRLRLMV